MAAKRTTSKTAPGKPFKMARAGSWMALLAATTLGVTGGTVRAQVTASDSEIVDGATYRLVVQTYDGPVARGARPVGSFQRVVTGAELKSGVRVNLLELRESIFADSPEKGRVVAWLEAGSSGDLEFDGRRARPAAGSVMGQARRSDGTVQISLNRKIAA